MRLLAVLLSLAVAGSPAPLASDHGDGTTVVRVLYLDGMDTRDAVTLLRSQAQVRQVAEVRDRDLLIVAGSPERVARCEAILRELDALDEATTPHPPWKIGPPDGTPDTTHVFHFDGLDRRSAVTVMRSIYQVRRLSDHPDRNDEVVVTELLSTIERIEALFESLDVLGPPGG